MYWFKHKFVKSGFVLIVSVFVLPMCKPDIKKYKNDYFELNSYFLQQGKKYADSDFYVLKTVSRNGEAETKRVKIADWPGELSVFSESDINKPAWKNSYKTTVSGDFTIYSAKEPDLKTREIILKKQKDRVKSIMIFNTVNNQLFQTREKLTYYPDSLYIIQRKQHVRFLGTNDFLITGKIKK